MQIKLLPKLIESFIKSTKNICMNLPELSELELLTSPKKPRQARLKKTPRPTRIRGSEGLVADVESDERKSDDSESLDILNDRANVGRE